MSTENCVSKADSPPIFPPVSERVWRTESRFLFAKVRRREDIWLPKGYASDNIEMEINAGCGCVYSAIIRFPQCDYSREMVEAVSRAISDVNRRWNLPESANDGSFSGNRNGADLSCPI